MVWQRARKPEQKEQRKTALLQAAAQLFEERPFDEVSLNEIARTANISKANIYRYFCSREELFLHILADDYLEWVDAAVAALEPLAGKDDEVEVASALVATAVERRRMCQLVSVLSSVIEKNVDTEVVIWFKTTVLGAIAPVVVGLQAALPSLSLEQSQRLLLLMHVLVQGMWAAANPPPPVQEAYERNPELQIYRTDFERDLTSALAAFIRGLRTDA